VVGSQSIAQVAVPCDGNTTALVGSLEIMSWLWTARDAAKQTFGSCRHSGPGTRQLRPCLGERPTSNCRLDEISLLVDRWLRKCAVRQCLAKTRPDDDDAGGARTPHPSNRFIRNMTVLDFLAYPCIYLIPSNLRNKVRTYEGTNLRTYVPTYVTYGTKVRIPTLVKVGCPPSAPTLLLCRR
jgi:hypothetical protein